MKPRVNVITLGVRDLDRSMVFYRDGLGLPCKGILGDEIQGSDTEPAGAVALFELQGGLFLALYPRSELSKDAQVPDKAPSAVEFSLGYAAPSREAVDALLLRAAAAGATLTEQPHDRAWGIYSGYFLDPDGHLWEILWNPKMSINDHVDG